MVYARAEKRERSQKRAAQDVPREWRANNPVSHVGWNQTKQRAARTSVWFIYKFLKGPVIFRIFFITQRFSSKAQFKPLPQFKDNSGLFINL